MNSSLNTIKRASMKKCGPLGKMVRSQSLPSSLDDTCVSVLTPKRWRSASLPTIFLAIKPVQADTKVHFSLCQSNVLYCMFLVCAAIFLAADIFFQLIRKRLDPEKDFPSMSTLLAFSLFLVNCVLWINFNWAHWRSKADIRYSRYEALQE